MFLQKEEITEEKFCITSQAIHSNSQCWPGVSCLYDMLAAFKLPCNTSHIKSPAFTSTLIILRYDIIFYTQNI